VGGAVSIETAGEFGRPDTPQELQQHEGLFRHPNPVSPAPEKRTFYTRKCYCFSNLCEDFRPPILSNTILI